MDVCIVCRDTEEDFTDLFTKKQGSLIGMNTIGTKPLIPQEYRKGYILRKGKWRCQNAVFEYQKQIPAAERPRPSLFHMLY